MKLNGDWIDPNIFKVNTSSGDSVETVFTLSDEPVGPGSLWVYINGLKATIASDYTLLGKDVTFLTAPVVGQEIEFNYIKKG